MQKKSKRIIFLLFISLIGNIYLGINSTIKSTYMPNLNDQDLLGEMTEMVLETK